MTGWSVEQILRPRERLLWSKRAEVLKVVIAREPRYEVQEVGARSTVKITLTSERVFIQDPEMGTTHHIAYNLPRSSARLEEHPDGLLLVPLERQLVSGSGLLVSTYIILSTRATSALRSSISVKA